MAADTLNMKVTSLGRVITQIKHQLEDEDTTPVIILGKSGIGKTESMRDLTEKLGIGFTELRLSHYQESDLVGLPFIDSRGRTSHAATDILPDSEDKGQGILLLDEVTSAPKSMRSAVYQLLDTSRSLGTYHLPEKWLVIACGNGPEDGGDFRGIEPAFLSRGFCYRVEENLAEWKSWAAEHGIHPAVTAYLSFKPEKLHVMDPDRPYDLIACPRNWTKLSGQLYHMEKRTESGIITDENDLEFAAMGCVGARCGEEFAAFYRFRKEVIDPESIYLGEVPAEELKNLREEILYLTMQTLAVYAADAVKENYHEADGFKDPEAENRFLRFLEWVVDLAKKVRLDAAVALIRDISAGTGGKTEAYVMTEEFDAKCSKFADFAMENIRIL